MFCKKKELEPFQQALATIRLDAEKRTFMEERYLKLIISSKDRCKRIALYFHLNRTIITIGSIIVPALISIQYTASMDNNRLLYWMTWMLSLLVTISNGILTLFKIDKKYYLLHTSYEQMKSEGWQYMSLTGHYGKNKNADTNSHEIQFNLFCQTIERIRMRQMEEEYIKLQDVNTPQKPSQQSSDIPNLVDIAKSSTMDDLVTKITKIVKEQNLIVQTEETPTSHGNSTPKNFKSSNTSSKKYPYPSTITVQ